MEAKKLRKFKAKLEQSLQNAKQQAADRGVNVNTPEFKDRIDNIRARVLQKLGISKRQYDNVEEFLATQDAELEKLDVDQDITEAMLEIRTEKVANETPREILRLKIALKELEKKRPKWNEIEDRPRHVLVPFNPATIRNLSFSQINHTDTDHAGILRNIITLQDTDQFISSSLSKAREELQKDIQNGLAGIKISHDELLGVGPDDHHPEHHDLESHRDSEWKELFKRLIGGGNVDDLHRHAFPHQASYNEPWGMTQGDGDGRYVQYSGGITMPTIVGNAGEFLRVNATENGIEWVTATGSAADFVDSEVVAGDTNTFTLANTPIVGSVHLYANGQRLTPGGVDYTITGAIITTVLAWDAGTILADYRM